MQNAAEQTRHTLAGISSIELENLAADLKLRLRLCGVAIALASESPDQIVCVVSCGEGAPPVGTLLDINSGISGHSIREARILYSYDTAIDPRVNQQACERLGIRSVACAPIPSGSGLIGIVEAFAREPGWFQHESLDEIAKAAEQIASLYRQDVRQATSPQSARKIGPTLVPCGPQLERATAEHRVEHRKKPSAHNVEVETRSSNDRPFVLTSDPGPDRRWPTLVFALAMTSAVVSASWVATRVTAHGGNGNNNVRQSFAPGNRVLGSRMPGANASEQASPITARQELVSEATGPVRMLMAKALAGNSNAQASLADHYAGGQGVKRDLVKATVWYIMAGSNGNQHAKDSAVRLSRGLQPFEVGQVRFNLGTMFRDGIGTAPDLTSAYLWFSLANTAGDVRAPEAQATLEDVMKPAEVAEARRRAAEWLNAHRPATASDLASNRAR